MSSAGGQNQPQRSHERLVLGALAVGVAAITFLPAPWIPDDGWFYLVIGDNVARGEGWTFSRVEQTNGFHPLWGWVVAVLAFLARGTGAPLPSLVALTGGLLLLTAWVPLRALGRHAALPRPDAALAVIGAVLLFTQVVGSEAWLAALTATTAVYAITRAGQLGTPIAALLAGIALGAHAAARLDGIFFAALGVLALLRRDRPALVPLAALGVAVALGPVLAWEQLSFGHPVPISGQIKSTFPTITLAGGLAKIGPLGQVGALGALALAALARRATPALRNALLALAGGALAQAAYTVLFTAPDWNTEAAWTSITSLVALALAACFAVTLFVRLTPSVSPWVQGAAVSLLIVLPPAVSTLRVVRLAPSQINAPGYGDAATAFGLSVGAQTPPDAIVWTFDAPGRIAWQSQRRVIAADGLTGSPTRHLAMKERGLAGWFADNGVTHVIVGDYNLKTPWGDASTDATSITNTVRDPRTGARLGALRVARAASLTSLAAHRTADAEPTTEDAHLVPLHAVELLP